MLMKKKLMKCSISNRVRITHKYAQRESDHSRPDDQYSSMHVWDVCFSSPRMVFVLASRY